MWWKRHKWKILAAALTAAVLAAAFYTGGSAPAPNGREADSVAPAAAAVSGQAPDREAPPDEGSAQDTPEPPEAPDAAPESPDEPEPTPEPEDTGGPAMEIAPETGKDPYQTDPVPEGRPLPVEPQDVTIGGNAHTCTISISCAAILDNLGLCDPDKVELVPEDGWILEPLTVTFYEGESVFHVLLRTCKQQKIHMEYEDTPIYNSAYIEGIQNLYEFDVGDLSGWMYAVNGWFPNYGCSRYQLQDGDVIQWVYTCDLGSDVGGGYSAGGQRAE